MFGRLKCQNKSKKLLKQGDRKSMMWRWQRREDAQSKMKFQILTFYMVSQVDLNEIKIFCFTKTVWAQQDQQTTSKQGTRHIVLAGLVFRTTGCAKVSNTLSIITYSVLVSFLVLSHCWRLLLTKYWPIDYLLIDILPLVLLPNCNQIVI